MSTLTPQTEYSQADEYQPYRALSKAAVFSTLFGLLSLFGFLFATMAPLAILGLVAGLLGIKKIRRFPNEFTGLGFAKVGLLLCTFNILGATALHTYVYLTEVPEGYVRLGFSELDPRPPNNLPVSLRAIDLNGKKVFIKGYIHPGVAGRGDIKDFVLVGDLGTCCFGGQPKLSDMVEVKLADPYRLSYNRRKQKLGGVFKVRERIGKTSGGLDGGHYQLIVDYVK